MQITYPPELNEKQDDPIVRAIIQLYELLNLQGVDESNISNKSIKGRQILLNNNEALQARNSSGTATNVFKLGSDNILKLSQLRHQAITTSTTQEDVVIQFGWSYVTDNTTGVELEKTITFPTAFTTVLYVNAVSIGKTNTTDVPTAITDFTRVDSTTNIHTEDISTTTVLVRFRNWGIATGAFLNDGKHIGFSWMAIGTI